MDTDAVAVTALRIEAAAPVAPTLVFGIGNPSRGDDAIGPLMIERLEREQSAGRLSGVDLLTDFQLQPEHALDLRGRARVLFVDASLQRHRILSTADFMRARRSHSQHHPQQHPQHQPGRPIAGLSPTLW